MAWECASFGLYVPVGSIARQTESMSPVANEEDTRLGRSEVAAVWTQAVGALLAVVISIVSLVVALHSVRIQESADRREGNQLDSQYAEQVSFWQNDLGHIVVENKSSVPIAHLAVIGDYSNLINALVALADVPPCTAMEFMAPDLWHLQDLKIFDPASRQYFQPSSLQFHARGESWYLTGENALRQGSPLFAGSPDTAVGFLWPLTRQKALSAVPALACGGRSS